MTDYAQEPPAGPSAAEPGCAMTETALGSFMGERRRPLPGNLDEADADWVILPLFQVGPGGGKPYRLGFFPVSGRYAVRRLDG